MGKKLAFSVASNANNAALGYERKNGRDGYRSIKVYKGKENIIELKEVHVMIFPSSYGDSDLRRVDIFWEEAGIKEYKKFNLFGTYSCDYCPMSYNSSENTLEIMSDNNISIHIN